KSGGFTAIPGNLIIGDDVGGANADIVRHLADKGIDDNSVVTVNSSGLLDLNGFNDNIGTLNLTGGNVTTGIGQIRVTHINTTASSQTATISGRMDMLSVMGEFNVADGAAAIDLDVSGRIQDGNMRKFGSGVMRLSGTVP